MNNGRLGKHHSEKSKKKISQALLGHIVTTETRNKITASQLGRKLSEKTKKKLSEIHKKRDHSYLKGRILSLETRKKISMATKGEKNWNWKGGYQYHLFLNRRRRVMKKGAMGSHTLQEWEQLKKFYGYICLCCKKTEPDITLSEDHIIPLTKGGSDYIDNIQPLCRSCNSRKRVQIFDYRFMNLEGVYKIRRSL